MSTTDTTGLPDYAPVPSSGFPPVEVLATAGFALSIVDERKDSAGITSDTSQILPSSNQNIYIYGEHPSLQRNRGAEENHGLSVV